MATVVDVSTFYEAGALVGKGGIWDAEKKDYYWVDIAKKSLHVLHLPSQSRKDFDVGTQVGALALRDDGEGLVMAVEDGFGLWSFKDSKLEIVATPYGIDSGWRMNDGACDSMGRFWAGRLFKSDETQPGVIYRLETDGKTAIPIIENICCTNGILWNPDNTLMYCGDSSMKKIYVWDYDEMSGTPSNQRLFLDTSQFFDGVPDGATIDNEGFLWVCFYDGNKLVRISPDAKVDMHIDLPVKRPTQPVWFGDKLDELLVTSASQGVDTQQWPLSGHVLRLGSRSEGKLKAKFKYRPSK